MDKSAIHFLPFIKKNVTENPCVSDGDAKKDFKKQVYCQYSGSMKKQGVRMRSFGGQKGIVLTGTLGDHTFTICGMASSFLAFLVFQVE